MRFKLLSDFLTKGKRVYFTSKAEDKLKNIKITGTKISTFFEEKSSFRVWSEIFGFYVKTSEKRGEKK